MARLPFIAGNWKMNKTVGEAVELVRQLKALLAGVEGVEVAVAPPFTALYAVRKELEGSSICLAAQNLFWEEKGAFTGEISPLMLKDLGCQYVIIGHSERRQFFGETDETVNQRMKAALNQGLNPIFCVGRPSRRGKKEKTFSVIGSQLEGGLKGIAREEMRTDRDCLRTGVGDRHGKDGHPPAGRRRAPVHSSETGKTLFPGRLPRRSGFSMEEASRRKM